MRVSCLQIDPQVADPDGNLKQAERALMEAAERGVELCLLPEMWPTSFTPETSEATYAHTQRALDRIARLSEDLQLVIAGSAYAQQAGASPTNRFHCFEKGELVGFYDKGHLFSPTGEQLAFSAGAEPPGVIATSLAPVHGIVCYDLRFPAWVRPAQRDGSQVMLVCAQWPDMRASHWRNLMLGRAVEGQCFVVACNRRGSELIGRRKKQLTFPGNSLIVDPGGNVLSEADPSIEFIDATLDLELVAEARRAIPVWKDERVIG